MEPKSRFEVWSTTPVYHQHAELAIISRERSYDPSLCKTCQKVGLENPRIARAKFSDCEEHYQRRVQRLLHTGVTVLSKTSSVQRLFSY
jgi:hypothetical protein